ncbi:unnamed protein product [Parnassius apollo]|uniref:(apollo) hypothetical protein n=1 Tax=Parnassius apollo TaxID=110799 RepID=A0A8S3WH25_PARAO|nr:unnamed protein product [Parnassius apollo]
MASRHLNLEQISNLLNEDEEEPFDESDDELGIGEHLAEQQNDNSDSEQRETDSEDEAGPSSSQYYIGRDKQTKWSQNSSNQRIKQELSTLFCIYLDQREKLRMLRVRQIVSIYFLIRIE